MCARCKLQFLVSISMRQSVVKTYLCEGRPDFRPNEWKLHSLTLLFYRSLRRLWLGYKPKRKAIHSNYSDSRFLGSQSGWSVNTISEQLLSGEWVSHACLKGTFYKEPSRADGTIPCLTLACLVGKFGSLPFCLCRSGGGMDGVIETFQLFCSMLGEPYVQREEVRWRTPSRDASSAWGESKLRRHFLSGLATWLARETLAACLQLLAFWKNWREENFNSGSSAAS